MANDKTETTRQRHKSQLKDSVCKQRTSSLFFFEAIQKNLLALCPDNNGYANLIFDAVQLSLMLENSQRFLLNLNADKFWEGELQLDPESLCFYTQSKNLQFNKTHLH